MSYPVETTTRQRMLYITPVMPAEFGNGLAMRAANVLRCFVERYDVSLLIVGVYPAGIATTLPSWVTTSCRDVRWAVAPPSSVQPDGNRIIDDAWCRVAGDAYLGQRFDIIHVFRLVTLPFAMPYRIAPSTADAAWHIDFDDVESRSMARLERLRAAGSGANAASAGDPHISALEASVLQTWDRVYVCSGEDREWLRAQLPDARAQILVLPNMIAIPERQTPPPRRPPLTLMLLGNFGYEPNVDAAIWFCRVILPTIREQSPLPLRLRLVGTGAPESVRSLRHIPDVEYVGAVEQLDPWYRETDIVVVPLRSGGGTRIKVLEALAYTRPVVSTTIGAEGLGLVDGVHLLLADRAHHFAQQCLRVISDIALADRLARDGHNLVAANYTVGAVVDRFAVATEPSSGKWLSCG